MCAELKLQSQSSGLLAELASVRQKSTFRVHLVVAAFTIDLTENACLRVFGHERPTFLNFAFAHSLVPKWRKRFRCYDLLGWCLTGSYRHSTQSPSLPIRWPSSWPRFVFSKHLSETRRTLFETVYRIRADNDNLSLSQKILPLMKSEALFQNLLV